MTSETRDYLKIGLLAVIAVSLTYGTFFKQSKVRRSINGNTAQATPPPLQTHSQQCSLFTHGPQQSPPSKPQPALLTSSSHQPAPIQWGFELSQARKPNEYKQT